MRGAEGQTNIMNDRKIRRLLVDTGTGSRIVEANECNAIESFTVNGEMAPVTWYRQGNSEYNGKYVISVDYDN